MGGDIGLKHQLDTNYILMNDIASQLITNLHGRSVHQPWTYFSLYHCTTFN